MSEIVQRLVPTAARPPAAPTEPDRWRNLASAGHFISFVESSESKEQARA